MNYFTTRSLSVAVIFNFFLISTSVVLCMDGKGFIVRSPEMSPYRYEQGLSNYSHYLIQRESVDWRSFFGHSEQPKKKIEAYNGPDCISPLSKDLVKSIIIQLQNSKDVESFIKSVRALAKVSKHFNVLVNSPEMTTFLIKLLSEKEKIKERYAAILLGTAGSLNWLQEHSPFKPGTEPITIKEAVKIIIKRYAEKFISRSTIQELLPRFKEDYYNVVFPTNGKTALILGIEYAIGAMGIDEAEGGINTIKALLALGVDPNKPDRDGKLPISYTYMSKCTPLYEIPRLKKIQELLITAGATIPNEALLFDNACEQLEPQRLLTIACFLGSTDLLNKALGKGASANSLNRFDISDVIDARNTDFLKIIVQAGCPLKKILSKDKEDTYNAFCKAVGCKDTHMLEFLILMGLDVNVQKKDIFMGTKSTPLKVAVLLKKPEMIKLLLKAGAELGDITDQWVLDSAKEINQELIPLCLICLDYLDKACNIIKTECDHRFHKACLQDWHQVKAECPACRNALPKKAI